MINRSGGCLRVNVQTLKDIMDMAEHFKQPKSLIGQVVNYNKHISITATYHPDAKHWLLDMGDSKATIAANHLDKVAETYNQFLNPL